MEETRRPVPPNPPRWHPNPDPTSINVPGLDTGAPVLDQIEQMEQLITIKLQNIDENFSKIHNLLASKLLPAVKRYAVGTEPVREAAKFWTSFYEQAAQIRIPTYDDHSTVDQSTGLQEAEQTPPPESPASDQQSESSQYQKFNQSEQVSESSFMPSQAAFSSTPATARRLGEHQQQSSVEESWSASVESPLVRLDRELQIFSQDDLQPEGSGSRPSHDSGRHSAQHILGNQQPLLRSVLKHRLYSESETSASGFSAASPSKTRGKIKTPVPKNLNPYLPPNINPSDWKGVVDLRDPSIATPPRRRGGKSPARRKPAHSRASDSDESFDGLPPGMSPPVLMSPARPPRSTAELGLLKLGQTPVKEASSRIRQDLVRDMQRQNSTSARRTYGYPTHATESSMSTVPTPPSLSRYYRDQETSESAVGDSSLESMMERFKISSILSTLASTPGLRLRPRPNPTNQGPIASTSQRVMEQAGPSRSPRSPPAHESPPDFDSDSDSMDEINDTAHPSAAFLMASQGVGGLDDDSFGSSDQSMDSFTEEAANLGLEPVNPFGNPIQDDAFDDDDSFDDDHPEPQVGYEEETLFGLQGQQRFRDGRGLRMLGEDLLQDTIGIGAQRALSGTVEESPTPASWSNLRNS